MTFNTDELVKFNTIILEQIKIGVQKAISGHMLYHMKIDIRDEMFCNALITSLTTYAMKESLKEETFTLSYKQPKNSWQMFKTEYFPKWLLKGFPIEYEVVISKVTFEAYEVYPQLPQVYDVGHHFTEISVKKNK